MSLEGRIAVDIGFTDTYSAEGVQNVQRISLSSAHAHTAGKVLIVSGTMTTAGTSLSFPPAFKDAAGNTVTMTQAHHVAFKSSRRASLEDAFSFVIQSFDEEVSLTGCKTGSAQTLTIASDPDSWTSGTAAYSIFLFAD